MTSPPRGRLKGVEKYQKTSRRHRWKEAAATHERNDGKAMDCRQHFQTGIKSPCPWREGGGNALRKPKVGDRKIILK